MCSVITTVVLFFVSVSIDVPGLVTSEWYKKLDQRGMWTQLYGTCLAVSKRVRMNTFPHPHD